MRDAVDGDQLPLQLAQIEMIVAHRRAVDDPQQHLAARLDPDDLGIGERAVIRKKSIVFDVVQIGRDRARSTHRRHPRHLRHPALSQPFIDLLRRYETEIVEQHDNFRLVRPITRVTDDEWRKHQGLLLQALMGMHPESSAKSEREVVISAAARRDRRPGNPRDPVLPPGWGQAVPMDKARLVDPVHHTHAEGLANLGSDAERAIGLTDSEHGRRLAVNLDAATSEIENCLRRRGVARHRCG
jgi:hypothetical protein